MTRVRFRVAPRVAYAAILALIAGSAIGRFTSDPSTAVVKSDALQRTASLAPTAARAPFDFAHVDTGWVEEFQSFGAFGRQQAVSGDLSATNAPHAGDVGDAAEVTDTVAAAPVIAADPVATADAKSPAEAPGAVDATITGTISQSQSGTPLLPPVPGADAFKVGKTDQPQPMSLPGLAEPAGSPSASRAGTLSPHAALAPALQVAPLAHAVRPAPGPVLAAVTRKPGAPVKSTRVDTEEGTPPIVAARTVPATPALGYANPPDQTAAPFRSLFKDNTEVDDPKVAALPDLGPDPAPIANPLATTTTPRARHATARPPHSSRHRWNRWAKAE